MSVGRPHFDVDRLRCEPPFFGGRRLASIFLFLRPLVEAFSFL
jgi:hypothetical protein